MSWGGVACMIFVRYPKIRLAQRHPDAFSRPADMNDLACVGQILAERGNSLRGAGGLEIAGECEITGNDTEIVQVLSLS